MTGGVGRRAAYLVALLTVLAACGSTVDPDTYAALQRDGGDGLGLQPPTAGATIPGPGGLDPGPGGPGGPSGPGGPGGLPSIPPGATAPGVTADTITIGFVHGENQSEANRAVGSDEVTAGDEKPMWEALIDEVNDRGGIAGRRIVPVFHPVDALSNETFDSQLEGACQTFTQDHRVYAALGAGGFENYIACLERAGVITLSVGANYSDDRMFARFPHYVEIDSLSLNRMARATVESLYRRGYFGPGARIGVVTYDWPAYDRMLEESLEPALAAHGLEVLETARLTFVRRLSDTGTVGSQASSAALRFKTRNITHVLVLDSGSALATTFFMEAADNAEYTPRYGLNTLNGGSQLPTIVPGFPERQLHDSLMLGWQPSTDLAPADFARWPANATRRRCLKVMADHGLTFDSPNAESGAHSFCGVTWFLERAVEEASAGDAITTGTFLAGVHAMGTRFEGGDSMGLRFGPAQHDGVAMAADAAYVESCTCFRYTGSPYSVP